jgi:hypothetical protein
MQEAAQEVKRIKQEATADSRKDKKAERYRATMEKLGKLPPSPKLCRGRECNGIPCEEEEPGFPYSYINNMVLCHDESHVSLATRDGCFLFHLWQARKRSPKPPPTAGPLAGPSAGPPAKNSGGANVKVIANIMDPAVQLVGLHFSHHAIGSGSATLGAFVLGGIYREWTPLLNCEESLQRLDILLSQVCKAAEHGA